jgi:hypothetical protein
VRSRLPPRGEGKAVRDADSGAAGEGSDAVRVRGISRPAWRLKRCLTTQAGEISPEGETALPRVQAGAEPGKMRGFVCPRSESHLTYMIDIPLTTEFSLASGGAR